MRNIMGLFAGGIVGISVIFIVAGMLSPRNIFMDGAPGWPWLIALPVGTGIGYVIGKKLSRPKNND